MKTVSIIHHRKWNVFFRCCCCLGRWRSKCYGNWTNYLKFIQHIICSISFHGDLLAHDFQIYVWYSFILTRYFTSFLFLSLSMKSLKFGSKLENWHVRCDQRHIYWRLYFIESRAKKKKKKVNWRQTLFSQSTLTSHSAHSMPLTNHMYDVCYGCDMFWGVISFYKA